MPLRSIAVSALFLFLTTIGAWRTEAQTLHQYSGSGFNVANNHSAGSSISVTDSFEVSYLRIVIVLDKVYAEDTKLELLRNGSSITFVDLPGFFTPYTCLPAPNGEPCAEFHGIYTFDDTANVNIDAAVAASAGATVPGGVYAPNASALSGFVGSSSQATWQLRLADWVGNGTGANVQNWTLELYESSPTGITVSTRAILNLYPSYPNPFNPSTTIPFSVAKSGPVTLSIFDASGEEVITLLREREAVAGIRYEIAWHGLDSESRPVASGVYFARLSTAGASQMRKLVLLK